MGLAMQNQRTEVMVPYSNLSVESVCQCIHEQNIFVVVQIVTDNEQALCISVSVQRSQVNSHTVRTPYVSLVLA